MNKKWWILIIILILVIVSLVIIWSADKVDESGFCGDGNVIVDCNPGFQCVSEEKAQVIDCLTIASTPEGKAEWDCSGEGRYQCTRK